MRHLSFVPIFLLSGLFLLSGCDSGLRRARQAAEATGNAELHRVAETCAGDPQKLEAACFLLENLRDHYTYTFDLIDPATGTVSEGQSLYRKGITADNYRAILDSLGVAVRYRTESDAETMTAEYLIRNIDQAFEGRRKYPWAGHYSDSVFLRYVLPYRIDAEELTDWRTFFRARYEPMIDTLAGPKTVRNVAQLIIRDVRSQFGFAQNALMLKPAFTPQEAFACGRGECNSIADIHVLALRAMGIAAAKDVIPMWGSSDGGHVEAVYFDEEGNPVMLQTGDWLAAQPPKVYRMEFEPQPGAGERFGDPYYRDVTAEYVATSDVVLTFDSGPEDPEERAALAVFGNERWRPAVLAEPTEGTMAERVVFRGIGRGILYLPVWVGADRRSMRVAGRPVRIDPRGNLDYYDVPDTSRRTTVDLTPLIRRQDLDTWDPADYYVAYWARDRWQPVDWPIVRTTGMAVDGSPAHSYSVSGLPERAIYAIFRRSDGRTYHRRIFRAWQGEPTRF